MTRALERPALVALTIATIAFVVLSFRIQSGPDLVYDEAVYTRAAQNVANDGRLTWRGDPVFVHPPLSFLLHSLVLRITDRADGALFDAIAVARIVTTAFGAATIGLLVLLLYELTPAAGPRRRLLLASSVGVLAMFDPVFLRYTRLATIESLALFSSMLVVLVAWRLRDRPATPWILIVGLLTGVALLVKEITIFITCVPVVAAILARDRDRIRHAVGALAVAFGFWLTFPAWAISIGFPSHFFDEKFVTLERLLGILQVTGWNRPSVSFLEALRLSAPLYISSYVLLATGAAALVWLWIRRGGARDSYLTALLGLTYAFGAYTVARGQLNEQFFIYLMPGAILGTVLGADALQARYAARRRDGSRSRMGAICIVAVGAIAATGAGNWVRAYAAGTDDGVRQMAAFVGRALPACAVVNSSGDPQKYAMAFGRNDVVRYASGPRALSRGVRYFLLSPKDVWARYGQMHPGLERWIRTNGTLVRGFPSQTYWRIELWSVDPSPFDPLADIQPIPGGAFVNTKGSACGGFPILDRRDGRFHEAYVALGGKPVLGRPASHAWRSRGRTLQAFDAMILATRRGAPPRPIDLVPLLARRSPERFEAYGLPLPGRPPRRDAQTIARLSDPVIARRYLGVEPQRVSERRLARAARRWGLPLSRPTRMPDGVVRQAFEHAVLERSQDGTARPVLLAPIAADLGVIPDIARAPEPVPDLAIRRDPQLASDVTPFLRWLAVALLAWLLAAGALAARSFEHARGLRSHRSSASA